MSKPRLASSAGSESSARSQPDFTFHTRESTGSSGAGEVEHCEVVTPPSLQLDDLNATDFRSLEELACDTPSFNISPLADEVDLSDRFSRGFAKSLERIRQWDGLSPKPEVSTSIIDFAESTEASSGSKLHLDPPKRVHFPVRQSELALVHQGQTEQQSSDTEIITQTHNEILEALSAFGHLLLETIRLVLLSSLLALQAGPIRFRQGPIRLWPEASDQQPGSDHAGTH
ncbi:hypothetical protein B0T25DRAFT_614039 [Lasiosphaeria hispida]|uniref:Uncharacterized protein n=1 Tax=Lasiosphaeria hispida TaxID=260671 RepID=A0AAJ0HCL4_9PEZI|nr:hypothetical protein B0T25DRAFT_614039 [Lasiosphaeria hispida]